jgi:hypothetical protein
MISGLYLTHKCFLNFIVTIYDALVLLSLKGEYMNYEGSEDVDVSSDENNYENDRNHAGDNFAGGKVVSEEENIPAE